MFKHALLIATVVAVPATASAEPMLDSAGMRVGGYGFRETADATLMEEASTTGWEACRMNGMGVFVTRDLDDRFFLEGAIDTYFTDGFPTGESTGNYDTPIDRVSGLMSVAAGARWFSDSWVSPYVQLGLGAEVTRVRLPALGLEDTAVMPMGFFGLGAALNVSEKVSLGASFRVNAMGYYDDAQFQTELDPSTELATQGQFYAAFNL
jgi:hypothetical protein